MERSLTLIKRHKTLLESGEISLLARISQIISPNLKKRVKAIRKCSSRDLFGITRLPYVTCQATRRMSFTMRQFTGTSVGKWKEFLRQQGILLNVNMLRNRLNLKIDA